MIAPPSSLAGARVLLIAPRFFGYDEAIARELERCGARVERMADRPYEKAWFQGAARVAPALVQRLIEAYYRRRLAEIGPVAFDHVFVLNGQTVSRRLLERLRAAHPQARFTFYLWDSLFNRPTALATLPLFDRAFTFEHDVAAAHGMRFRPLFFDQHTRETTAEPIAYDISFVGTGHTDRNQVVARLDRSLPAKVRRFWYLYLQARWVLWVYKATTPWFAEAKPADFRFTTLSRAESQQVFEQTRAILDIEHPRQSGLTIRTLEVLGAGKKLVTTNAAIRDYAFFDPARIEVIDRRDPHVPEAFLQGEIAPLAPEVRDRYSLAGWIEELFSEEDRSAVHLKPGLWRT